MKISAPAIRIAALVGTPLLVGVGLWVWVQTVVAKAPPSVREPFRAMFFACAKSAFLGEYWEGELQTQLKTVRALELADRAAFFRETLLNCPMDGSSSLFFAESIGKDAAVLLDDLIALRASERFKSLSRHQQGQVESWIVELPILIEQGKKRPS